jgi:hypothetical protein
MKGEFLFNYLGVSPISPQLLFFHLAFESLSRIYNGEKLDRNRTPSHAEPHIPELLRNKTTHSYGNIFLDPKSFSKTATDRINFIVLAF